MKLIAESHEISPVTLVGGKGYHLQKLLSWEAPVAPFLVITTEAHRYFKTHKKIPDGIRGRVEAFLRVHPKVALRSSMIAEDNLDSSFAGLFETLLNVNLENWEESLIRIWDSVHSSRVSEYIEKKNMTVSLEMAVVLQELIEVDKSGVLFTRSPVTPTAAVAIDAGFGLGEGVVSGHTDVDNYLLTRSKEIIAVKKNNQKQVLSKLEMDELMDLALHLEKEAKVSSDIEWGYKKGKLYLFQIRPITRSFEPLRYFVDTNLSESYPGVVSPFTGAFVKKAYENVFTESAIILGANGERLEKLKSHYAKLISSVDDHLYYNLEHYYAILRALPGGERNIENWHKMIGGKVESESIPYHPTELSELESLQTIFSLLKIAFRGQEIFPAFLTRLEVLKGEIESETNRLSDPDAIILYLNELIDRPIGFGLTVVNDIFIMMGLGFLTRVLKKKGVPEDQVIDLLKTSHGVDSTKPLQHLDELLADLSDEFIESLNKLPMRAGEDPYHDIFRNLSSRGWVKEVEALEKFLELYGDRSFEELKLESLPIKNNPSLLKELLVWARNNPPVSAPKITSNVRLDFNFLEKKILKFTREAIANREATRLWRGKYYHLLRKLILKLSSALHKTNSSWRDFSIYDFFSLSPIEWMKFREGSLSEGDVQKLMHERRSWQTKKKHFPEIIQWVEGESLPEKVKDTSHGSLSGQGVSPGVVEGMALVLENPQDAFLGDYKDYILVTKNTDPAWVYIMSRSLGLISEKGSLLSHTAIIGRELNIPTIVGVKMATQLIKTGDRLRIDGTRGTIEKL